MGAVNKDAAIPDTQERTRDSSDGAIGRRENEGLSDP